MHYLPHYSRSPTRADGKAPLALQGVGVSVCMQGGVGIGNNQCIREEKFRNFN